MSDVEEKDWLVEAIIEYLRSEENKSTLIGRVITIDRKEGVDPSEDDLVKLKEFAIWTIELLEKAVRYQDKKRESQRETPVQQEVY